MVKSEEFGHERINDKEHRLKNPQSSSSLPNLPIPTVQRTNEKKKKTTRLRVENNLTKLQRHSNRGGFIVIFS